MRDATDRLWEAIMKGRPRRVRSAIRRGADLDRFYEWPDEMTVLALACTSPNPLKIIPILLEAGADPRVKPEGEYPVLYSAVQGGVGVVRLLLDAGADPDDMHEHLEITPLHEACERGDPETIKLLIERSSASTLSHDSCTHGLSIHHALLNKKHWRDAIQLLLDAGVGIDDTDEFRSTPLMLAAEELTPEIVSHLLGLGADASLRDTSKKSALNYACERAQKTKRASSECCFEETLSIDERNAIVRLLEGVTD